MHCRLVVPDLFWPAPDGDVSHEFDPYAALELPAIRRLLARGRRKTATLGAAGGLETWLATQFGVPAMEAPLARYRALGDGLDAGDGYWLAIDPVHMRVSRDHLVLADAESLAPSIEEACALAATLDSHFAADGIAIHPATPTRWYARLTQAPALRTTPLASALGRAVEPYMPAGDDGGRWRAFMNEAQMLMHEHPVNNAREASKQLPINSVWVWGAGASDATPRETSTWASGDPLVAGLAHAAHRPVVAPAADLGATLTRAGAVTILTLVLDTLRRPAAIGDIELWQAGLRALERDWFAPALDRLKARQLGMVSVHAPCGATSLTVEITAGDLRYFWRRDRPLASYLA
jgi:hypothetical protein